MDEHRRSATPTDGSRRPNPLARHHWPRLIELRAAGMGVVDIARELGLRSHAPVSEALALPEVTEELERLHRGALDEVQLAMAGHALSAVETLAEVMRDRDQPGAVRVKAATEILDRLGVAGPGRVVRVEHGGQVEHRHAAVRPEELAGLSDEQFEALAERIEDALVLDDAGGVWEHRP